MKRLLPKAASGVRLGSWWRLVACVGMCVCVEVIDGREAGSSAGREGKARVPRLATRARQTKFTKATKGGPTSHGRFDGCRATAHPSAGLQGPRLLSSSGRVPTAHPWRVSQDLLAYLHKQGLHTRKGSPGLRDERCGFHQTRGLTSTFISAA